MANNPSTLGPYVGKIDLTDLTNYPHGKARDISTAGDGTGTPRVKDEINDIFGFQQALLTEAGITPSGSPDTALVSQYLEAIKKIVAPFLTLAALQAKAGDVIIDQLYYIEERTTGNGGGAWWKAIAKTTENGWNIVTGNATVSLQLAVDKTKPLNAAQFGVIFDASMTALGVLSGTDATAALQAALDYAATNGIPQVSAIGKIRLDSPITVPDDVTLWGGIWTSNPLWRINTGWEGLSGSILYINHGAGLGVDDYDNSAFEIANMSGIQGYATVYPGQDMTAITPTTFPPTISIQPTAQGSRVERMNCVNAYSFVDARRDHANLYINNIVGYPIAFGYRTGSMTDNDYPNDIHFQPLYGYRDDTTPGLEEPIDATNSLAGWINQNGNAFDLGRNSMTDYIRCFAFGYNKGVNGYYQATGTDVTIAGGTETADFIGCGFDSCYYPYYFDRGAETINTHWGVTINGGKIVPKDAYNLTGRDDSEAIHWVMYTGSGLSDLTLTGGLRIHGAKKSCLIAEGAKGVTVDKSVKFMSWGEAGSGGSAIQLTSCTVVDIDSYFDGQSRAGGIRAIKLVSGNSGVKIKGIYHELPATGIEIVNASNEFYFIKGSMFDDCTLANVIDDAQGHTGSEIGGNYTNKTGYEFLSNSDVDGSGILQIHSDMDYCKYTGTATINGITGGRLKRKLKIRFSAICTVTDEAGGVGSDVLRLSSNMTTSAGDTLSLISDGAEWDEGSRSLN